MAEIFVPRLRPVTIRRDGPRVILEEAGQVVFDIDWSHAVPIARALLAKAREAEEEEKAASIAADQSVLMRAGWRIGLTDRADIKEEAMKQAIWDPKLRKYIRREPVEADGRVGTPGLKKEKEKSSQGEEKSSQDKEQRHAG